ncbi:hypothetical protein SAMN05444007_105302 [Cribrihabitans marinus]|uniref:Uncharacterized protein n=1 Tax=Cribrihabitans marinus TaxID=1227549 RepID=A0A1H6ZZ63_9RHOB|nr:hypothetical protein [Cribrihabitans marinus]GGH29732.1 hypothetical protein GCM10010973_19390 [Cribrihabitans marinus]SEJ58508.1 hypothetical protein SAMN05444007_105302 [Cribrihabitans marinus]
MKKILLPAFAFAALSACTGLFNREGVGFTGIDGEPRTLAEAEARAGQVSRNMTVPVALGRLPTVRVATDEADLAKLARTAISNGGRSPANAVEVGGNRRPLMLSTVAVNNVLFAVLRTPDSDLTPMEPSTGQAFVGSVPKLTGCLPAGNAYGASRSGRSSSGFAVPINCR